MRKIITTGKCLGPKETEVIARLSYEKLTVIMREQIDKLFNINPSLMNRIIFQLKKKGLFNTIKKGVYFYPPLETGPAGRSINAGEWVGP